MELATSLVNASHVDNDSTGSEQAMQVCATWLKRCLNTHEKCRAIRSHGDTYFNPSRLIEISEKGLRLVVPDVIWGKVEYVALSHCWGLVPIARLLKANYVSYLHGIDPEALSRTFTDAIETARVLGFQYIWIDSLCIIQDCPDDWKFEAETMCDVYANASLTIAAAHAAGGDVGCFWKRDGRIHAPFLLPLSQDTSPDTVWAWFMTFGHISTTPGEVQYPLLFGRAWVLQEQLLSPRILIFNKHHLQWDCVVMQDSDASPGGGGSHLSEAEQSIRLEVREGPGYFKKTLDRLVDQDISDADLACYKVANWHQIVQAYTHRGMTNTNDRLVALFGIARALMKNTRNKYQAGLWSEQLWRSLLWKVSTMEGVGQTVPGAFDLSKNTRIRHEQPLAPSWSWASITAPVVYQYDTPMIDCICEIISSSVKGDIAEQEGSLIIRGHVRRGHVNPVYAYAIREAAAKYPEMCNQNPEASDMRNLRGQPYFAHEYFMFATEPPRHRSQYSVDQNRGWRVVRGEFNADEIIDPNMELTFVAISARNQGNRPGTFRKIRTDEDPITVYTLALLPIANGMYKRVGLAIWNQCAWFGYRCGYEPPGENLRERRHSKVGGPMDTRWKQKLRKLSRWPDLEFYKRNPSFRHTHKFEANILPDLEKYHDNAGAQERTITIV